GEEFAQRYLTLKNCDLTRDLLIAEAAGEMIGYCRSEWETQHDGLWTYLHLGYVRPAWRRRGLGTALLRAAQQRLREIAAGHPPDAPKVFAAWAESTEIGAVALLQAEGYKAVRHDFHMVRPNLDDIPDLPLPAGIEV